MSVGTTIWNITEYLTYLCIIIQTMLMLLGYAAKGLEGATSDDGLNAVVGNLSKVVNGLLDPPKKGNVPASQKGRR